MKKILVGVIAMACTLSTFAAEEASKGAAGLSGGGQLLKFTVNQDTKTIEDAPGSNLIQTFQGAIGKIHTNYGALGEKNEKELQTLDSTLKEMQQGSIERLGAELYRAKLTKKIGKLAKQREELSECEPLLQEVLQIILHPSSDLPSYIPNFYGVFPNVEVFKEQPFKEINFKFSCWYDSEGRGEVGENFVKLKIDGHIPMDINNKLQRYFNPHGYGWYETGAIQEKILEKGELIYRISTDTEDSLGSTQSLMLNLLRVAKADPIKGEGKTVLERLKQDIDKLTLKVEQVMIPKLEIPYLMAKIIMAFQEEAPRHREQA